MHGEDCEVFATVAGIAEDMRLTGDEARAIRSSEMQAGVACNCGMTGRARSFTDGELRAQTRRWVEGCRKYREGGVVGAVAANSFYGAGRLKLGEVPSGVDLVQVDESGSGTVIWVDFKKRARIDR